MIRSLVILLAAFVIVATTQRVESENLTVEGIVTVVRDGDTIELGPVAIRLQGIAAPGRLTGM